MSRDLHITLQLHFLSEGKIVVARPKRNRPEAIMITIHSA